MAANFKSEVLAFGNFSDVQLHEALENPSDPNGSGHSASLGSIASFAITTRGNVRVFQKIGTGSRDWRDVRGGDYLYARMTGDQTFVSGNFILFDNIQLSGNLSGSSGTFTLNPHRAYELVTGVRSGFATGSAVSFTFRNVTTAQDIGTQGVAVSPTNVTELGIIPVVHLIVRHTSSVNVGVRMIGQDGTGTPIIMSLNTYLTIKEI